MLIQNLKDCETSGPRDDRGLDLSPQEQESAHQPASSVEKADVTREELSRTQLPNIKNQTNAGLTRKRKREDSKSKTGGKDPYRDWKASDEEFVTSLG